jgi:major membrane immunogen (membrane-anchored lipoprotein)
MERTVKNLLNFKMAFILVMMISATAWMQAQGLKDGTFTATYDSYDDRGWKPQLSITVKAGKIDSAVFDETNREKKLKSNDKSYEDSMKKFTKTFPKKYSAELISSLLKKQSVPADTVTGATSSTVIFNELAKAAMDKASKGDQTPAVLPYNTTYTAGESKADNLGYMAKITVTYKDGSIVKVVYDEYDKNKKTKRENAYVNDEMKKQNGKLTWQDAVKLLEDGLVKSQNPDKVDSVTGATSMSKKFVLLAKEAIKKRQ